jgi:hypothetical protein
MGEAIRLLTLIVARQTLTGVARLHDPQHCCTDPVAPLPRPVAALRAP